MTVRAAEKALRKSGICSAVGGKLNVKDEQVQTYRMCFPLHHHGRIMMMMVVCQLSRKHHRAAKSLISMAYL